MTKDGGNYINYVKDKVKGRVDEIKMLWEPQAAYVAFIYGVKHKWNYLMRTVPNISQLLETLERTVRAELIPALTNG